MSEQSNPQSNQSNRIAVGTHNGRFHADEVMATQILKYLFEENDKKSVDIIRTRDQKCLDTCDLVVDVGKIYDPETNRFDHHQESCQETFSPNTPIPLSSAGLVWRHYGQQFLSTYLQDYHTWIYDIALENNHTSDNDTSPTLADFIEELHQTFYYRFIQEIDGHDNGVPSIKESHYHPDMYNYYQNLNLGNTISLLNFDDPSNHHYQLKYFKQAQELAWDSMKIHLDSLIIKKWKYLEEKPLIEKEFYHRTYPYLLVMNENFHTWRQHIKRLDKNQEIKFTVYPRNQEKTEWGFSTNQNTRFQNDIDLLSEGILKGNQRNPISLLENHQDLVFVHKNLFCGGARNQETAIRVCVLSYEYNAPPFYKNMKLLVPGLVTTFTLLAGVAYIYKRYKNNN